MLVDEKHAEHVWPNHLTHLGELFASLRSDGAFLDVTLACRGGFLRAHRLVLSAFSPYFKAIFEENPCAHPTIALPTVSREDMARLVEFMYRGRVVVPESCANILRCLAADLEVKGFENFQPPPQLMQHKAVEDKQTQQVCPEPSERSRKDLDVVKINVPKETEVIKNVLIPNGRKVDETKNISEKTTDKLEGQSENDSKCSALATLYKNFECDICKGTFKTRKILSKHKKIHQEKSFSCDFCGKLFSRASHLIRHRRVHTGERPFICPECGKDFARQDKLKVHIRTSHSAPNTDSDERTEPSKPRVTFNLDYDSEEDDDDIDENGDHIITLDTLIEEKRARGRPKKIKLAVDNNAGKIKRGRGRPRKGNQSSDNYHFCNLPYGDIDYLTMSPATAIEPLVEIKTPSEAIKTDQTESRENEDLEAK